MAVLKVLDVLLRGNTEIMERDLKKGETILKSFRSRVTSIFSTAIAGGGIAAAFLLPVQAAARMEQTAAAFEVLTGSMQDSKTLMGQLEKFGADTPFEFPELADSARKLLAFGTNTKDIVKELTMIGDISSGVGAPINQIAELYGKARVQGTLFAADINQLMGRGIPVLQEFAKQLGVDNEQVKKLASQGKIGFSELEKAFQSLTSEGGKFAGMMDKQSKTTLGKWSTLKDNIGAMLRPIGDAMLPTINSLFDSFNSIMPQMKSLVRQYLAPIAKAFVDAFKPGSALNGVVQMFGVTIIGLLPYLKAVAVTFSSLSNFVGGTVGRFIGLIAATAIVVKLSQQLVVVYRAMRTVLASMLAIKSAIAALDLKTALPKALAAGAVFAGIIAALTTLEKDVASVFGETGKAADEMERFAKAASMADKSLNPGSVKAGSQEDFEIKYGVKIQAPMNRLIEATEEGNGILDKINEAVGKFSGSISGAFGGAEEDFE